MPEVVVIGAGPNGLTAANILADHGLDVVVLEAEAEPGGAVRSAQLIEPGFVNDVASAFYPLGAASPVITALHLEDHGLRWLRAPLALAHPSAADGTCPVISTDIDETAASFSHRADGDAWRRLFAHWQRLRDPLLDGLTTPFPPVRAGLRILGRLRPSELLDVARLALLPVRRLGEERFAGDDVRRLLAGNALHTDLSPESTLSGLFGCLLALLAQDVGWPVPEGGAGMLTRAMVDRLGQRGGKVLCGHEVEQVVVRAGRAVAVRATDGTEVDATRAVVADVPAPALYLDLVGAEHLPDRLLDDLRRFEWDSGTVKVDWNLDGPVPWTAAAARRAGTVHLGDSVDVLTRASADLATGRVPQEPFLLVGQQSMTDPTRMPPGKETAWAYTHVPRDVEAPSATADRMEAVVEGHAPGFRALIRGRHVATPPTVNGGTAQLHQQLVFRPTPGWGRAETPIKGLFLGSSSAHPGGGVHGACGANAARAALGLRRYG
jgi:phytoene dehydrogenase-like protein